MNPIQYSKLSFEHDIPLNQQFDECYFSRAGGIPESTYVFLEHNFLIRRWQQQNDFVIGEFGFGTGLNFFLTVDAWLNNRRPTQTLHYYAVEKFPIQRADLQKIHQQWPQFTYIYEQLYPSYPDTLPGLHCIELIDCGVVLYLMIGDAVEQFSSLNVKVDAWYLDGFSPAKNQSMWSDECFNLMAEMSQLNTTFATFTAAGFVRRGLQAVGFDVMKAKGFGQKREMLYGKLHETKHKFACKQPWFSVTHAKPVTQVKTVGVIGAGLAGLFTAWMLTNRGVRVSLFDKAPDVASGASGNPCGLVMPRFSNDFSLDAQFYYNAFTQTTAWLGQLKKSHAELNWQQTGIIQLLNQGQLDKTARAAYPDCFAQILTKEQVSEKSALPVNSAGLYFPWAGYLSPKQLCEVMLQELDSKVSLHLQTEITQLNRVDEKWLLSNELGDVAGVDAGVDAVVLANSYLAEQLLPGGSINIEKNRGQLSMIKANTQLQHCQVPLVYESYVTPPLAGIQTLGASYATDAQLTVCEDDHVKNLLKLQQILSEKIDIRLEQLDARVSFRAYSQDRMPIVGAVHDETFYQQNYADLHHGRQRTQYPEARYHAGLYVNVAHGSRGLVSSLPCARLIADLITEKPLSMSSTLLSRIHPARFLVRKLKKSI